MAVEGSLPDYINRLNEPQREAALHTEGPLIVLAGAGSGKTGMLTARVAYLIGQLRVPAYRVLAVTFTNKAAGEMRERVEKYLASENAAVISSPEIGTFHSVCARILRKEAQHLPFKRSFVIYDEADQLSMIKEVMRKLDIDSKQFNPKAVRAAINRAKCDAIEPHDYETNSRSPFEKRVRHVYLDYQNQMIANSAVDFGEIICLTYRLLRDQPLVRKKYQSLYQYIHVDEYQDTNRAQYLLLSMLAAQKNGGNNNICVVGDEDQSIYGWRGADINNILDFENDFGGAHVVKLEQNYRSTQTIITAASQLISHNTQRKDKKLWTSNREGEKIALFQVPDERMEAEAVVSEIGRLARDQGKSLDEFAIFYRTHAQSRQFEDVLRREKLSYQVVGGLRFYDRKEIKDILAYFKLIHNPADTVSLKRIINVPARGIGKTTLEKLEERAAMEDVPDLSLFADKEHHPFWKALLEGASHDSPFSRSVAGKLARFVVMMKRLTDDQPHITLTELYHLILDETRYVEDLKKEGTPEALSRVENLKEFDTLLQEFEEEVYRTQDPEKVKSELLSLFLERSVLETEAAEASEKAQIANVKMMTLHSSKGLEFPVVFLVGLEEGLFPSHRPWEETSEEEIEEERRLCYVGMTRAREQLYLLTASTRRIWGEFHYQEPARFLSEIPMKLVLPRSGLAAQRPPKPLMNIKVAPKPVYEHDEVDQRVEWVGRKIRHPQYGVGTVILGEGSGESAKVTIEFAQRVRRKFVLKYLDQYWV